MSSQPAKIKLVIKKDAALGGQGGAPPAAQPVVSAQTTGDNNIQGARPASLPPAPLPPEPSAQTTSQGAGASKPAFKFKVTLGPNLKDTTPTAPAMAPPPFPEVAAPRLPNKPKGPKRRAADGAAPPGPKRPKLNASRPKGPKIPTKIKLKAPGGPLASVPEFNFAGPSAAGGAGPSAAPAVVKLKVKPTVTTDPDIPDFGVPPGLTLVKPYKRRGRKPKSAMPSNLGDRPAKVKDDVSYNVNIKPREYSLRNITSTAALADEDGAGDVPFMMVPASEAPAAPAMPLPVQPLKPATNEELEKALNKVWDKDAKGLFRQPVTDAMAPNYSQIITKPMDLSTMKKKLEAGEYKDWEDFDADLMLMFDNALTYNIQGDQVWKSANSMKAAAIRITNDIKLGKKPKKSANSVAARKQALAAKAQQRAERDQARTKARAEQRAAHEAKVLKRAGVATGSSIFDDEDSVRMSYRRRVVDPLITIWGGLGGGSSSHGVQFASLGRLALQPRNPAPSAASVAASLARFASGLSGKLKDLVLARVTEVESAPPGPRIKLEEKVAAPGVGQPGLPGVGGSVTAGGGPVLGGQQMAPTGPSLLPQMPTLPQGGFMGAGGQPLMGMGLPGFVAMAGARPLGMPTLPVVPQPQAQQKEGAK